MAWQCTLCQKASRPAVKRKKIRSKFNPVNYYRQKVNLQWFTVGKGKRIRVCSDCRRKLLKTA